jgi:VanZ family protein
MAAIFWESSLPEAPLALPQMVSDKAAHALEFCLLAFFVVRALAGGLPARIRTGTLIAAMLITSAYGASDELHQLFVPNRSAEFLDWVADGTGAVCGSVACWAWGIIAARPARDLAP